MKSEVFVVMCEGCVIGVAENESVAEEIAMRDARSSCEGPNDGNLRELERDGPFSVGLILYGHEYRYECFRMDVLGQ